MSLALAIASLSLTIVATILTITSGWRLKEIRHLASSISYETISVSRMVELNHNLQLTQSERLADSMRNSTEHKEELLREVKKALPAPASTAEQQMVKQAVNTTADLILEKTILGQAQEWARPLKKQHELIEDYFQSTRAYAEMVNKALAPTAKSMAKFQDALNVTQDNAERLYQMFGAHKPTGFTTTGEDKNRDIGAESKDE